MSRFRQSNYLLNRKTGVWIDIVADYGADNTGTYDCKTIIQNAVNALPTGGGIIYFPKGTYLISDVITLKTGVSLIGQSRQNTFIYTTVANKLHFTGDGLKDISIENMVIEGNAIGGGIKFTDTAANTNYGIHMRNVYVQEIVGDGINIDTAVNSHFSRVWVRTVTNGNGFVFSSTNTGGTSVVMDACQANACDKAGFYFNHQFYSTLNGCGSELSGLGFQLIDCTSFTLNGCGTEVNKNKSANYPGYGYYIGGGFSVNLNSCYSRDDNQYSVFVTQGNKAWADGNIIISGLRQTSNNPATTTTVNSLYIDNVSPDIRVDVISPNVELPMYTASQDKLNIISDGKLKRVFLSAIPTTGTWNQGDIVYNTTPASGGYLGWVCTASGTFNTTAWAASTAYTLGQFVNTGGNVYKCTTAGTSGTTAPTGTAADITDGTAHWKYVNPLNATFKTFGLIS